MKKKIAVLTLSLCLGAAGLAGCGSDSKLIKANPSAPDWEPYDQLITEAHQEADPEVREGLLHEAESMLMDTGAILPIYDLHDAYLKREGIEGDYTTKSGIKYFMYAVRDGQPMDNFAISLASEPDRLDPALAADLDALSLAANSFVGLYRQQADGSIVPALAEGEPEIAEDGRTYVIHLKNDLKWSDGSSLTAGDFVYAWGRAANPATGSANAELFGVFEGYGDGSAPSLAVEAVDDQTLRFQLTAANTEMKSLLALPAFSPVPQAMVEAGNPTGTNPGAWAGEAGFVTNGAYTLAAWEHGVSMVYVKNPNYYDAENVTADQLQFLLFADDQARLDVYESGALDYADRLPDNEILSLRDREDFHALKLNGTYFINFNVNTAMFRDRKAEDASKMRRALALLVDRTYITEMIGQTGEEAAASLVPAGMSDGHGGEFLSSDQGYTYPAENGYFDTDQNLQEAKKLMKEAGFKFDEAGMLRASTSITIKYLAEEGSVNEAIGHALEQDFARIGIVFEVHSMDRASYQAALEAGDYEVASGGIIAEYDDPICMLEKFASGARLNYAQLGKEG